MDTTLGKPNIFPFGGVDDSLLLVNGRPLDGAIKKENPLKK